MNRTDLVLLIKIAMSTFIVFSSPYFLKKIKCCEEKKRWIYKCVFLLYLICVILFAFVFRSKVNGTGVIFDPLWAYRQLFGNMRLGYESGGFIEAIKRIRWARDTVASLVLNILFFVPMGYLIPCTFSGGKSRLRVLILAFLLSIIIELLQYITNRGWLDVSDPIYNSIGALIGFSLFARILHETEDLTKI